MVGSGEFGRSLHRMLEFGERKVWKHCMSDFIKGMDISTLLEVEKLGGKFYKDGIEMELLSILETYGVNYVRLRLWNDPFSEDGKPYGAGGNDFETTMMLAKRALKKKMGFLLDFHYSDFWTDPGKQFVPKAWRGMNVDELEQAVFDYTKETLLALKREEAFPTMIQVGNELTNGMLWPYGQVPEYDNLARFVNAGIKAVRAVDKDVPIMIHLDNGGNNELYRTWFDEFMKRGENFQIIGMSYYPFWHGTLADLENNMNDVAKRYGKDIIIAEVSMGFTMEDYQGYEKLPDEQRKGMATRPALAEKVEYPITPEGPCGNEWANQELFDYDGNALPAFDTIRDFLNKHKAFLLHKCESILNLRDI